MLPVPKNGKFRSINYHEIMKIEHVSSVDITVSKNSQINMPPNGEKYLGFVFSQGENKTVVMQALKTALKIAEPVIDS